MNSSNNNNDQEKEEIPANGMMDHHQNQDVTGSDAHASTRRMTEQSSIRSQSRVGHERQTGGNTGTTPPPKKRNKNEIPWYVSYLSIHGSWVIINVMLDDLSGMP